MTSISLAGVRHMPSWLKGGMLATLAFGSCWGGAIWYWRAADRAPATGDLALYLLALPLTVLLAFWAGRKLIAVRAAPPVAVAAGHPAQAASSPSSTPPLAILAASLRSAHGSSVEELAAALADDTARPDLDPELVDDDGFPVMSARSSDANDEALQEEVIDWLARSGMEELRFSEEQWRALTMATAVVGELASQAAADLMPVEGTPPLLQLIPILPADWPNAQRRAAGIWLQHTATQFGWPAAHIALAAEAPDGEHDLAPPAVLARLAQQGAANKGAVAALVVACASHIGEETVARWAASGALFTARQPQGLIPGEGAAGLLVCDQRQARSIEGAACALLGALAEARRDSSAGDSKRADSRLLGDLAERALKDSAASSADVAMIVADTGHRSSRVLELMGLATAAMPQLDGAADVVRAGVPTGACGDVPFMIALALARHHALERAAPVVCISNEDPYLRCATLVRPGGELS